MKSLTISARLWLPPLVVTVLLLAVEGGAMWHTHGKIDKATQWAGLTEANAARALAVLNSSDTALGARPKPEIDATSARITALQQAIEAGSVHPDEAEALAKVTQSRKVYIIGNSVTTVEQSAAATDNLRDESQRLSDAVHKFRIEGLADA